MVGGRRTCHGGGDYYVVFLSPENYEEILDLILLRGHFKTLIGEEALAEEEDQTHYS